MDNNKSIRKVIGRRYSFILVKDTHVQHSLICAIFVQIPFVQWGSVSENIHPIEIATNREYDEYMNQPGNNFVVGNFVGFGLIERELYPGTWSQ